MRGSRIIVTADPKGQFDEGFVNTGETFYPGVCVQRDPTQATVGGRFVYKLYAPGADGENPLGAYWIVTDHHQGLGGYAITSATSFGSYAAGDRVQLYSPRPGEELNLLIKNISGTADAHAKGEKLMVDNSTGMFIATTGSPESEAAQLLETLTDPTADTLAWCQWAG